MVGQVGEVVTVQRVLDSNTVMVLKEGVRDSLTVDLAGVGTPETVDPKKPMYLLGVQDPDWMRLYLLVGTKVLMEKVGESSTGRPLVVLYRLGDRFCWNSWLIEVGGAFFTTTTLVDFSDQEEKAQAKRLGLWSLAPKPTVETDVMLAARTHHRSPAPRPAYGSTSAEEDSNGSAPIVVEPGAVADAAPRAQSYMYEHFTPPHRRRRRYPSQTGAWDQFDAYVGNWLQQQNRMSSMSSYSGGVNPNQHQVRGYWRGGTYVDSHMRTNPNGTTADNFGRR